MDSQNASTASTRPHAKAVAASRVAPEIASQQARLDQPDSAMSSERYQIVLDSVKEEEKQ